MSISQLNCVSQNIEKKIRDKTTTDFTSQNFNQMPTPFMTQMLKSMKQKVQFYFSMDNLIACFMHFSAFPLTLHFCVNRYLFDALSKGKSFSILKVLTYVYSLLLDTNLCSTILLEKWKLDSVPKIRLLHLIVFLDKTKNKYLS